MNSKSLEIHPKVGGGAIVLTVPWDEREERPPFANETWVVAELTDRDLRYQQQREEQLEQRLFDLKYKEKVAPAPVKPLIKEDIERTNRQLERTRDEIKEMRKKK